MSIHLTGFQIFFIFSFFASFCIDQIGHHQHHKVHGDWQSIYKYVMCNFETLDLVKFWVMFQEKVLVVL